jgi:hypothetical protein
VNEMFSVPELRSTNDPLPCRSIISDAPTAASRSIPTAVLMPRSVFTAPALREKAHIPPATVADTTAAAPPATVAHPPAFIARDANSAPSRSAYALFLEPTVVLSGQFCAWLERAAGLRPLALEVRGADEVASAGLHAIHLAALAWREQVGSANGSTRDNGAEAGAHSEREHFGTSAAARVIGITDRGVRLACSEGRLSARRVDGRWRIELADLERFKELRKT